VPVSAQWSRAAAALKLKVTLHAWRHTHASQLISAGMDMLSISRRRGLGSPSITLDDYGHHFHPRDDPAASAFENAFGSVLPERERGERIQTRAVAFRWQSVAPCFRNAR